MLMRMSHNPPDADFSIADQYRTPMMFLAGIAHEAVINKISDFDNLPKNIKNAQQVREELEEWLLYQGSIRLVPIK